METRTITQVKLYKLILNPMADCAESGNIAAISDSYDKLVNWYRSQLNSMGPWRDGRWYKVFAAGSPLEWYNPADNLELNNPGLFGHGILDEWVNESVYYDILRSGRFFVVQ